MSKRIRVFAAILAFGLIAAACGRADTIDTTEAPAPETTTTVSESGDKPDTDPAGGTARLKIGAKCGPSPHAMPLFVALAQSNDGRFEGGEIEFVPVTEPSQMAALLGNSQVDGMVGFIAQTANIFQKGGVDSLRLLSVPLWRAFYVVGTESVESWADVVGETVLMPDPQSGPSQLARASMEQAGFDPETDFDIQYLPGSQVVQMMLGGKAEAAVISEPFGTILKNKSRMQGDEPLDITPIDLYSVYEADTAWPPNVLPMEGFLALQETLDDPSSLALLQEFETAYYDAIDFMEANPAEASSMIVEQLGKYCGSNMDAKPLAKSISSGLMLYNPQTAASLLPDLDAYIEQVVGLEIDDTFYAPAGISTAPNATFPVPDEEGTAAPDPNQPTLQVGAKCGPTPHAMPLFAMMGKRGVAFDGFNLEYVPITEPAQMTALLTNEQIDVMLGQLIQTARMQAKGIPDLRLWSTSMSKGFYVVAPEGIESWDDLVGERVLMPGPTSGPTNLATASMRDAGYDPETDFVVEYLPASQIVQMMLAGKAPAAVVSEPFVTMLISRSKQEGGELIAPAPIDLYSLYESDKWRSGELPLDGVLTLQGVLDGDERAAFLAFVDAYNSAIDFIISNPAEAGELIASQLTEQCDSMMPAMAIQKTLEGGRLAYHPQVAADLLPDLDEYIELVLGQEVHDDFYATP